MFEQVYGIHPVYEAIKKRPEMFRRLVLEYGNRNKRVEEIIGIAKSRGIKITYKDKKYLEQTASNKIHQGIIAFLSAKELLTVEDIINNSINKKGRRVILILDGIKDPQNLGSIIRTAVAFGTEGIIISKNRSVGLTPSVFKASSGAIEYANISVVTNISSTIDLLKESGFWIVGTFPDGETPIYSFDFNSDTCIVIGSEEKGIKRLVKEKCDFYVSIPINKKIQSLNVSSACAIILYEISKR